MVEDEDLIWLARWGAVLACCAVAFGIGLVLGGVLYYGGMTIVVGFATGAAAIACAWIVQRRTERRTTTKGNRVID
jgi:Flp pilus assembly protein TadB